MLYLFCCSLLVLVNLSAAEAHFHVQQKPRFYGVKTGRTVNIICSISDKDIDPGLADWYKAKAYNEDKNIFKHPRVTNPSNTSIKISKVELSDSGIYFCRMKGEFGPGTELQVLRHSDRKSAVWRSNMKDFIIFLQGFLLLLCIVLPLVWYFRLEKKEEAVYEEPENDHTYEGLEVEQCGDLYEEIRNFSQVPQGPEAAWEVECPKTESPEVESPEQE